MIPFLTALKRESFWSELEGNPNPPSKRHELGVALAPIRLHLCRASWIRNPRTFVLKHAYSKHPLMLRKIASQSALSQGLSSRLPISFPSKAVLGPVRSLSFTREEQGDSRDDCISLLEGSLKGQRYQQYYLIEGLKEQ